MNKADMKSPFTKLKFLGENDKSDLNQIIEKKQMVTDDVVFQMQSLCSRVKAPAQRRNDVLYRGRTTKFNSRLISKSTSNSALHLKDLLTGRMIKIENLDQILNKLPKSKKMPKEKEVDCVNLDLLGNLMKSGKSMFLTGINEKVKSDKNKEKCNSKGNNHSEGNIKSKGNKNIEKHHSKINLAAVSDVNSIYNQFSIDSRLNNIKKSSDKELLGKFNGKFIREKYNKIYNLMSVGGKKLRFSQYDNIKGKTRPMSMTNHPTLNSTTGTRSSFDIFTKSAPNNFNISHSVSNLLQAQSTHARNLKQSLNMTISKTSSKTYHTLKNIKEIEKTEQQRLDENYEKEKIKDLFFEKKTVLEQFFDNNVDDPEVKEENKKGFDKIISNLKEEVIFNNRNALINHFGFDFNQERDLIFHLQKKKQDSKFHKSELNKLKLIRLKTAFSNKKAALNKKLDSILNKTLKNNK